MFSDINVKQDDLLSWMVFGLAPRPGPTLTSDPSTTETWSIPFQSYLCRGGRKETLGMSHDPCLWTPCTVPHRQAPRVRIRRARTCSRLDARSQRSLSPDRHRRCPCLVQHVNTLVAACQNNPCRAGWLAPHPHPARRHGRSPNMTFVGATGCLMHLAISTASRIGTV